MADAHGQEIYVWDRFVRIFHWTLAVAFVIAFLTEDDVLAVHVWAGYLVGVLIVLRVVWGLIGPKHSRFVDFLCGPRAIIDYVRDLLLFRAKRHIGHSPGGGAMVIMLLLSLAVTVGTGLIIYGASEGAGPLAPLFVPASVTTGPTAPHLTGTAYADEDRRDKSRAERDRSESAFIKSLEAVHEFFANFSLALVFVHIGAVLLASFVHRKNLIKAMVTGYKRR